MALRWQAVFLSTKPFLGLLGHKLQIFAPDLKRQHGQGPCGAAAIRSALLERVWPIFCRWR
jgi:hypothetical protein